MKISQALENLRKISEETPAASKNKNVKIIKKLLEACCLRVEQENFRFLDSELTEEALKKYQKVVDTMEAMEKNPGKSEIKAAQESIKALSSIGTLYQEDVGLDEPSSVPLSPSRKPSSPKTTSVGAGGKKDKEESPDWLTDENVRKVKERLLELAQDKDNRELANVAQLLEKTYKDYQGAQGEQKIKMKEVLYNIIHMPGWGHVDDERDEYLTMSREDATARIEAARQKIKEANLVGTEKVTGEMIDSASVAWMRMIKGDDEEEGQPLPIKQVGVPPVFCIDGPPGTGKTTIAQAVADAMDMGFYDLSMAGKDDANIVYGRGKQWGAPSPGLVAEAQIKSKRQRVVILLDEAEKATGSVPNALGQILEKTSVGYKDDYFEANIDKRKAMFVLTTNRFELLPEHIQSRVRKVYFGGYDDPTKVKILKNMAVNEIGRLQGSVQFQTSDKADESRTYNNKPFKGFKFVQGGPDVIEYIVKNYITEPGVREAKDLLGKIVTHAANKAGKGAVVIDINLVHEALGRPDPLNSKIKELNQKIGTAYKTLSDLRDQINEEYNKFESVNEQTKEKFSKLLEQLDARKEELLGYENQIVDLLGQRSDKRSREHMQEHLATIRSTEEWTGKLADKIKARYMPEAIDKRKKVSEEPREEVIPSAHTETEVRIAQLEKELAEIRRQLDQLRDGANEEEMRSLRLRGLDVESELSKLKQEQEKRALEELGTKGKAQQLTGTRLPVARTPEGPAITMNERQQYKGVTYGFSVIQRLKKEAGKDNKPAIVPNAKLTPEEFDAICKKEIKKIAKMKALSESSNLKQNVVKINEKLKEKPHSEEEAAKVLEEQFSGTEMASYVQPKSRKSGSEKYSAVERFEHKLNTIAMYETLSATQTTSGGVNTLVIEDTLESGEKRPIMNASHDKVSGLVKVVAEESAPGDKALLEMALFAQRCSKTGRFNIKDCEENPEAAIKLYLFGRSLELNPQLNAETRWAIAEYVGSSSADPNLAGIYERAMKNQNLSGSDILVELEGWEKTKQAKKGGSLGV